MPLYFKTILSGMCTLKERAQPPDEMQGSLLRVLMPAQPYMGAHLSAWLGQDPVSCLYSTLAIELGER